MMRKVCAIMGKIPATVVTPDGKKIETTIDPTKMDKRKRFPMGSIAYTSQGTFHYFKKG